MPVEWITTTTILRDLRDDAQSDAWTRLVARFHRPIASFAREMGLSAADAEDVAQETLLAFVNGYRAGSYDPQRGRLNRWLFGIAYRQALRQRENAAGREVTIGGDGATGAFWNNVADEGAASACFDQQWERAMLDVCMERAEAEFEPATFRAFELTVRDGLSAAEAAASIGVTVKSVYNSKHRVLKRIRELREQLEEAEP